MSSKIYEYIKKDGYSVLVDAAIRDQNGKKIDTFYASKQYLLDSIIDNVETASADKSLSANMGKNLQEEINNLKQRGRFLSLWNAVTGLPTTNPIVNPYTYNSGDYYIVSNVAESGQTNYRPDGSTYTIGQASTKVESLQLAINDTYYYDGTTWNLQKNTTDISMFVTEVAYDAEGKKLKQTRNKIITDITPVVVSINGESGVITNIAKDSDLTSEINARTAADNTLQTNISNETTSRENAITQEATARKNKDDELEAAIDTEVSARTQAISDEANARDTADTALGDRITQEISDRDAAIQSEATARGNADNALQTNIDKKQDILIGSGEGQNIKTVNNESLLGTGNISIPIAGKKEFTAEGWEAVGENVQLEIANTDYPIACYKKITGSNNIELVFVSLTYNTNSKTTTITAPASFAGYILTIKEI